MWATAILVVSIVDDKEFGILMLVILATVSLMNLRKENEIALHAISYSEAGPARGKIIIVISK